MYFMLLLRQLQTMILLCLPPEYLGLQVCPTLPVYPLSPKPSGRWICDLGRYILKLGHLVNKLSLLQNLAISVIGTLPVE
jgi:hypothetical protein